MINAKKILTVTILQLAFFAGVGAQGGNPYTTTFPNTENPVSEGGRWINGQTTGLAWKNVNTIPGLAYGADNSGTPNFNDPTAILTGAWGPDQTAQGRVKTVNQQTGAIYEEVELRLRTSISANSITGYEVLFRCNHDGTWYTDIVRWNGPLGNFTALAHKTTGPGLFDGDVIKATIIGNVITSYINGVQVNQVSDGTFTSGSPGIGFYLHGIANRNQDFGFTNFTASDSGTGPTAPSAPKNLRLSMLLFGSLAKYASL